MFSSFSPSLFLAMQQLLQQNALLQQQLAQQKGQPQPQVIVQNTNVAQAHAGGHVSFFQNRKGVVMCICVLLCSEFVCVKVIVQNTNVVAGGHLSFYHNRKECCAVSLCE